ncbi:hypothetical protein U0C82_03720 [Fulvimarina sp. 2208YS6-2-32]|uniref:Uncharacterized protein n=1 Tax=Fulvimarina uroteuthidis TaxID=3098149 RepID=A0ABU5HYR5_9HYPH|nr:hypothetical protein [Fulvimarina sp. 2208YS6-2-32]MDY8108257.1 hypothetical protein [Fulvimarina sp. 2208YS6-2-32]
MKSVRVVSEGGTSFQTKVFNGETGERIRGITEIDIRIVGCDFVRADIAFSAVEIDRLDAAPSFRMMDPATGEMKELAEITFADGSGWKP